MATDSGLYAEDGRLEETVVKRSKRRAESAADKGKAKIAAAPSENWDDDFLFQDAGPSSRAPSLQAPPTISKSAPVRESSSKRRGSAPTAFSPDVVVTSSEDEDGLDLSAFDQERTPQRRRQQSSPSPGRTPDRNSRTPTRPPRHPDRSADVFSARGLPPMPTLVPGQHRMHLEHPSSALSSAASEYFSAAQSAGGSAVDNGREGRKGKSRKKKERVSEPSQDGSWARPPLSAPPPSLQAPRPSMPPDSTPSPPLESHQLRARGDTMPPDTRATDVSLSEAAAGRRSNVVRSSRPPLSSSSRSYGRSSGRASHRAASSQDSVPSISDVSSGSMRSPISSPNYHSSPTSNSQGATSVEGSVGRGKGRELGSQPSSQQMVDLAKWADDDESRELISGRASVEDWDHDFGLSAPVKFGTASSRASKVGSTARRPSHTAVGLAGVFASPETGSQPFLDASRPPGSSATTRTPRSRCDPTGYADSHRDLASPVSTTESLRPDSAMSWASEQSRTEGGQCTETEGDVDESDFGLDSGTELGGSRVVYPSQDGVLTPAQLSGSLRSRKQAFHPRPSPPTGPSFLHPRLDDRLVEPFLLTSPVEPRSSRQSQKSRNSEESVRPRRKLRKKRPSAGSDGLRARSRSDSEDARAKLPLRVPSPGPGALAFADESGDEAVGRQGSPFQIVTEADLAASPPLPFPASQISTGSGGSGTRGSLGKGSDGDASKSKKAKQRRPLSFTGLLQRRSSIVGGLPSPTLATFGGRKLSTESTRRGPGEGPSVLAGPESPPRRSIVLVDRKGHRSGASTPSFPEDITGSSGSALMARVRRLSRGLPTSPSRVARRKSRAQSPEPLRPATALSFASVEPEPAPPPLPRRSHARGGSLDGLPNPAAFLRRRSSTKNTTAPTPAPPLDPLVEMSPASSTTAGRKSRPPSSNPGLRRGLKSLKKSSSKDSVSMDNAAHLRSTARVTPTDTPPVPDLHLQRPATTMESYDDPDFAPDQESAVAGPRVTRSASLGELKIPTRITNAQSRLNDDLKRVKEFARGIEELKEMRAAWHKLTNARNPTSPKTPLSPSPLSLGPGATLLVPDTDRRLSVMLNRVELEYAAWWDSCNVLINLGDGNEDPSPSRNRSQSMHPSSSPVGPRTDASVSPLSFNALSGSPFPPSRADRSVQILRDALGVPRQEDVALMSPVPRSSVASLKTSSSQPRFKHSPSSRSIDLSESDSSLSVSAQQTPTRRLVPMGRVVSGGLSAKRSASQLFRSSKSSKASSAVESSPRSVLRSAKASPSPASQPAPSPNPSGPPAPPDPLPAPASRKAGRNRAPSARMGINGIKDFLRVLKIRVSAEERGIFVGPRLAAPEMDPRRSVSDPLPGTPTSPLRPRPPASAPQVANAPASAAPHRATHSAPRARPESDEEENWDDLFGFNESTTEPIVVADSKATPTRRLRTQSTGSQGASSALGLAGSPSSPWPAATKLVLTTESMPQLLEYLASVKAHCREGLDEMKRTQ